MDKEKRIIIKHYEDFLRFYRVKDVKNSLEMLKKLEEKIYQIHPYSCSEELRTLQMYEKVIKDLKEIIRKQEFYKVRTYLEKYFVPLMQQILKADFQLIKEKYVVGVYDSKRNPLLSYKNRIPYLEKEASLQSVKLYYFTDKDVDSKQQKIKATYLDGNVEKKEMITYPSVVYNVWADEFVQQSQTQRHLRKEIPFMCHPFGDKLEVPQKLLQSPELSSLIIPFVGVTDKSKVKKFLQENKKGVLKPYRAARGEDIFFIEKKGNRYDVNHHGETISLTEEVLDVWIEEALIDRGYILQRYVQCETKDGKPYDMRVLMQKNGCGKWTMRMIYPRVGKGDSIISTTNEEESWDIFDLLEYEFGNQALNVYNYIEILSKKIAETIDNHYGNAVEEQGLDIAIDKDGNIWMYESNNKPGTFGVAIKNRSILAIAYAKYLAENQIYPTNQYQKPIGLDVTTLNLPTWKHSNKIIGNLNVNFEKRNKNEWETFAKIAIETGYTPYFFTFSDIDIIHKRIRGYTYENNTWKRYIFQFPDVYHDSLKMRKKDSIFQLFYEYLKDIPSTHTLSKEMYTKKNMIPLLKEILKEQMVDIKIMPNIGTVQKYLNQHREVLLTPINEYSKSPKIFIKRTSKKTYTVIEQEMVQENLIIEDVIKLLNVRFEFDHYYLEQSIPSYTKNNKFYDFRLHYIRTGKKEHWELLKIQPRISDCVLKMTSQIDIKYPKNIDEFLQRNLLDAKLVKKNIVVESREMLNKIEKINNQEYVEVTLGIVYDANEKIFKLNYFNPFDSLLDTLEEERMRHIIAYAQSLIKK